MLEAQGKGLFFKDYSLIDLYFVGTISPIPPGISNTEGTVSSSTSPQQQQNQQLSNVERNGIVGSVSVLTRGRGRGTTAASAIDLAQSGDEDEEDVDSSAPPAKRIATVSFFYISLLKPILLLFYAAGMV